MASQVRTAGSQGYYVNYDVKGKVIAIYSNAAKTTLRVSFAYDESGNRVRKTDHVLNQITYYVYDAAGSLLSVYDNRGTAMQQKELPVYAASRVGTYTKLSNNYQYELTDHLGNVRAVINEVKQGNGKADVVYYSDYYPYGSPLTLANNDYRYGYQGQYAEVDKETGWNNFDLRMYDPAIGRWMSTDPYGQYDSPYVGMGDNPVSSVDPDGGYDWWHGFTKWIGSGFKGRFKQAESGDRKGQYYISTVVEDMTPGEVNIIRSLDFGNGDRGGTYYPNGTITTYKPDLIDRWSDADNFIAKLTYKTADGFYLGFGSLMQGSSQRHLNGQSSLPNERIGAFINSGSSVYPFGKTIQLVPKLNAAEFSSLTAGTFLARLQPTIRGTVIKSINKITNLIKVTTVAKTGATVTKKQMDSNK